MSVLNADDEAVDAAEIVAQKIKQRARGGSTCKTFEVTNTSAAGIKIEVREMLLGQDYNSLVASISNSKLETTGASGAVAVIRAISSFAGAPATLALGNSLLVNGNTNGDGIYIGAGAVANVGQVGFSIGTILGTGFAVNGVTGATLISASNTFGVLPVKSVPHEQQGL